MSDLGEFKVLREILLPRASKLGDYVGEDCASISLGDYGNLIVSSDKGNVPLVWSLPDYIVDYSDMGWLTAVAGISDLATTGAVPMCATNNLVVPSDFLVDNIDDFARGFCDALSAYGFGHAGGDLSEGQVFSTSSTFFGISKRYEPPNRASDHTNYGRVVVIGELGTFAAGYCEAQRIGFDAVTANTQASLQRPQVPYEVMRKLAKSNLYEKATDASDGIITALNLLSVRSNCEISVELSKIEFDPIVLRAAKSFGVSEEVIGFAWGNWQQVLLVGENHWTSFEKTMGEFVYQVIGSYSKGPTRVSFFRTGIPAKIAVNSNEGFSKNSYVARGKLPFL